MTTRGWAVKLWLAGTLAIPVLWILQLGQALIGSPSRSIKMAVALDACGNALFGGDPRMTVSERAGLAAMAGKRWARIAAPAIDSLFGQGRCAEEARQWLTKHEPERRPACGCPAP